MDPLRWSFHMEESLELLEREKEHPHDEIFTTLIRSQLVGNEAHQLIVQDIMRGVEAGHTPSFVFQKGMFNRLKVVRDNMPPNANASCTFILCHLNLPHPTLFFFPYSFLNPDIVNADHE